MRREQGEPINVVDFKHEAMKCAHLILELAGGSHPQWFDLKNYPREYRKRGSLMFDNLHQKVKRTLKNS